MSKWVIHFVLEEIKAQFPQYGRIFTKIDDAAATALSEMSPLLRPLKQGFTSMTFATFEEWKSVLIVFLPLVSMICSGTHVEETVAAYLEFRTLARKKNHTDISLAKLNEKCEIVKTLLKENFMEHSPSEFNFHKFHDIEHIELSIKEYGALTHSSAQLEEQAHQENTKMPYGQTNRREAESQMAQVLWRKDVLRTLIANDPTAHQRISEQVGTRKRHSPLEMWGNARKRIFSAMDDVSDEEERAIQPFKAVYMAGQWGQGNSSHRAGTVNWFPLDVQCKSTEN